MDDMLYFNGLNGATGKPLLEPMPVSQFARAARKTPRLPKNVQDELNLRARRKESHAGLKAGLDPKRLDEAGWGVIFPLSWELAYRQAVRGALAELLDWRKQQAGDYYREVLSDDLAYRPGESKLEFLSRFNVKPGPADPRLMPYYLLIVGDPQSIPFGFQHELDVMYAVGRIYFETLEEYSNYAQSVVRLEKSPELGPPPQAVLDGTANPDDRATALSAAGLVEPLFRELTEEVLPQVAARRAYFKLEHHLPEQAYKSDWLKLLAGPHRPALLFTASHGLGFPIDHPRQRACQGALVCQDWPGPREFGQPLPADYFLSADDISDDACPLGLISFHFACYGAGVPQVDEFAIFRGEAQPTPLAVGPFLSALPLRLLGHPRGGALAFISHVDRAWAYSFAWKGESAKTTGFASVLEELLQGGSVGMALSHLKETAADLAIGLSSPQAATYSPAYLGPLWTAYQDARGYLLLGDPAVKLPATQLNRSG